MKLQFQRYPRFFAPTVVAAIAMIVSGCSSFGGDDEDGISAEELLAGRGTWIAPSERAAQETSTEPVVTLEIQGATADEFSNADGTVILQLLLRDEAGRVIINDLGPESFTIDASGLQLSSVSNTSASASVVSADVSEVAVKPPTTSGLTGVLLFDSSGSTRQTDRERRRVDAANAFIEGMPEGTQLAVLDFGVVNGGILGRRVVSAGFDTSRLLTDFSSDPSLLMESVARVTSSGGTPMYVALSDAMRVLEAVKRQGAEEQFLIVFTDGEADDYDRAASDRIVSRANTLSAPIHTVALTGGGDVDETTMARLQSLSAGTSGLSFTAFDADQLVSNFEQLAGAVDAGVTLRVELKFSTALPAGTWRLAGSVEASANEGTAVSPFDVVFSVD
jgi:hypothetical protein